VLNTDEARTLLDSIEVTGPVKLDDGTEREDPVLVGLRDRALIGLMVYTFARVNAALEMQVKDYYVQGRRGWVQLHEKGGKEHTVPCHHSLELFLDEYIAAAGIANDPDGWLFRTAYHRSGPPHSKPNVAAGRIPDDSAPSQACEDQNENRQSQPSAPLALLRT